MESKYITKEDIEAILNAERHSEEWLEENGRFTDTFTYDDLISSDSE